MNQKFLNPSVLKQSLFISDGKYHMLPTGELMIVNITRSDAQRTYQCRTHHRLTQEAAVSRNEGRIQLSGRFNHIKPHSKGEKPRKNNIKKTPCAQIFYSSRQAKTNLT